MKHFFLAVLTGLFLQASAQSPVTSSPFELFGDHIFVKIKVDDSEPLDFIFDTGDGLSVIDLDVAKTLKLKLDQKQTTTSAQGTISGALIKHNSLKINDFTLESDIKVYATSLAHLEISIGRNIDGIIGYDMLQHHVVRLDYDNKTLEVYENSFPKKGEKIAIKLHNAIPTVTGIVTLNNGQSINGSYYLNTGAGATLDFNSPFAKSNDIINKTGEHYSYLVKGLESTETRHYEGRVQSFKFGNFSFEELPIGISEVEKGIQGDKKISGIIGNRLLSRFNILFDYKGGALYMEKNSNAKNPLTVNSSGIDIQYKADMSTILIHQVLENSPASKAGIQVNDQLLSVNGNLVSGMSLPTIEKILKTPKTTVTLEVLSGSEKKSVELRLAELL